VLFPLFAVVCALLVGAGALKLRSPSAARAAGLWVPSVAVRVLGAAEVAIGVGGAARPSTLTALPVALAYGAFAAFVLVLMRSGGTADCGCFGANGTEVGLVHAVLNAAACGLAFAAAFAPPPGIPWILTREPLIAAPLTLGMVAAAAAAYLAFTEFPTAWRSYGTGGR
jgi:hypothetical protein